MTPISQEKQTPLYVIEAPERELLEAAGWRPISALSDEELVEAKAETDAWLRLSRVVRNHSIPYLQQIADLAREAAA